MTAPDIQAATEALREMRDALGITGDFVAFGYPLACHGFLQRAFESLGVPMHDGPARQPRKISESARGSATEHGERILAGTADFHICEAQDGGFEMRFRGGPEDCRRVVWCRWENLSDSAAAEGLQIIEQRIEQIAQFGAEIGQALIADCPERDLSMSIDRSKPSLWMTLTLHGRSANRLFEIPLADIWYQKSHVLSDDARTEADATEVACMWIDRSHKWIKAQGRFGTVRKGK